MIDGALVVDCHVDTAQYLLDDGADLRDGVAEGHVDLARLQAGGVDGLFFSIWIDPSLYRGEAAWARAQGLVRAVREQAARHPDRLALATTSAEVRAAAAGGRVAALMGIEGAHALGDLDDEAVALERLGAMRVAGVRYLTITWANSNPLAGASTDDGSGRGLSPLGRRVVEACGELGILVDVSHVSDRTAAEAIAAARTPPVASHSAARALCDHPRNLSDPLLRALADRGGVVCLVFYPAFLVAGYGAMVRELSAQLRRELPAGADDPVALDRELARRRRAALAARAPRIPIDRVVEHLAHLIDVAGEDHVGLGSDFDGIPSAPVGLEDVAGYPALARAARARGLPPRVVDKLLGANLLRALADASGEGSP